MFQIRVFAFLMSLLLCQVWIQLFRVLPTLAMQVAATLIVLLIGIIAAMNAWRLQMRSLVLYYTVLVCGIASALIGVMEALYAFLSLSI